MHSFLFDVRYSQFEKEAMVKKEAEAAAAKAKRRAKRAKKAALEEGQRKAERSLRENAAIDITTVTVVICILGQKS